MYPDWSVFAGLAVTAVFVWLTILTFWVKDRIDFFKSIFPKSGERDIRKRFNEISELVSDFKGDLDKLESKLNGFEIDDLKHIQKVALKRYNPYEDTGGDQSFSLALLDKYGNGFILTSLHARSGTRVFAKPVKKGEGGYKLSKEESETVEEAISQAQSTTSYG